MRIELVCQGGGGWPGVKWCKSEDVNSSEGVKRANLFRACKIS